MDAYITAHQAPLAELEYENICRQVLGSSQICRSSPCLYIICPLRRGLCLHHMPWFLFCCHVPFVLVSLHIACLPEALSSWYNAVSHTLLHCQKTPVPQKGSQCAELVLVASSLTSVRLTNMLLSSIAATASHQLPAIDCLSSTACLSLAAFH